MQGKGSKRKEATPLNTYTTGLLKDHFGRIFSSEGFALHKFQWMTYEKTELVFYVVSNISYELLSEW